MKNLIVMFVVLAGLMISNEAIAQKFKPVESVPDGKAVVYIYRPGSIVGAAVHYSVNANNEKVSEAHLSNKSYLVYIAEPGAYSFWAQVSNTKRVAELNVEAGKVYYIVGDCCSLNVADAKDAQKDIKKCKLSKP